MEVIRYVSISAGLVAKLPRSDPVRGGSVSGSIQTLSETMKRIIFGLLNNYLSHV